MGERFEDEGPVEGPYAGGNARRHSNGGLLDLGNVYAAIDHPRRRQILESITDNEPKTMDELATEIAARENDVPVDAVTESLRRPVYVALYHVHVPKLADTDVITVDADERVGTGSNAEQVMAALRGLYAEIDVDQEASRPDVSY